MEREQERVPPDIRWGPGSPTRCPWCKGEIEGVKEVVACAACGARHHGACHTENGRCATCGATDVLVPRAQPAPALARVKREEPPKGSKIRVEREGEALVYSWPLRDSTSVFLACLFMIVFPPLGLLLLYEVKKHKRGRIRLTLDEIEFQLFGCRSSPIQAKREDVGSIRVTSIQGGLARLTIDVGMDRHTVKTGIVQPALRPPELEGLAQALEAWKNEA
jgi:hypothetical protein